MQTGGVDDSQFDVVIVGAGVSGSSLLYTLARYTSIDRIALVEKYDRPGQGNSKATNNSQTLHVGDIETNYSIEKVKQVLPASMMIVRYADALPANERAAFLVKTPKMVLGVGSHEVSLLRDRFRQLVPLFPELQELNADEIARVEPMVMQGRDVTQPVVALYNPLGYAVDYERLAQSFIDHAIEQNPHVQVHFNDGVKHIARRNGMYVLELRGGKRLASKTVVVDADSYSLLIAKQLGYGMKYSLIPIAGTFYFSRELLRGKVYTVQEPKLPFAAVHGDPDVRVPGQTRWGPTARFHPVLESFKYRTMVDYFRSSGLHRVKTWVSFVKILFDPIRLGYLLKNMLYELPFIGTILFIANARKIVPTIRARDVTVAKGFGGMRLQRVDTETGEMQLGEGKIVGENIIFNMTPSPGASVALYNAMRDAEKVVEFLGEGYGFDRQRMERELVNSHGLMTSGEVSLPAGYAS
ncbi:MAG: FAD dependent oxidoreductase [Candidatus Uhrbacteria bacterium GW2011_GWD2_52_7]|uniref:malate dehydrogenase (quinone) n=1 Tax=Candidatus Uhrbacteria bacterium GW2011_GWD2_52_7 TaxID=1618989 RepID=A0A0G1ZKP8_9BACT|nr:MAG: FAD dependent oxidoreductase [Candidatus Uhrbacteria bacterium GW2011_GWD2_52_7]